MAVNFTEQCQNAYNAEVMLPDGGIISPQGELVPTVVEGPDLLMKETCLNPETKTYLMMDTTDDFTPCNLDVDIEKGMAEIPDSSEESIGCLKFDDSVPRALQKVIRLQIIGIFMQLFVHQSPDLPKVASKDRFVTERAYDAPAIRSRKFKRSPSFNSPFNSRRV